MNPDTLVTLGITVTRGQKEELRKMKEKTHLNWSQFMDKLIASYGKR